MRQIRNFMAAIATAPSLLTLLAHAAPPQSGWYLLAIHEASANEPGTDAVDGTEGFVTIYRDVVRCVPGDLLQIRGQIYTTNDSPNTMRGHIMLTVDGQPVGMIASEDSGRPVGPHHLTLWANAVFPVTTTGSHEVEAKVAVTGHEALDELFVESNKTGHLLVEHYRRFESQRDAAATTCRMLNEVVVDSTTDATIFGVNGDDRTDVYRINMVAAPGDLIRLLGQGTSRFNDLERELHRQEIFLGDSPSGNSQDLVGPKSAENTNANSVFQQLGTDGYWLASAGSDLTPTFTLTMSGSATFCDPSEFGTVVPDGGQLAAFRFSLASQSGPGSRVLTESRDFVGAPVPRFVVANSGWVSLIQTDYALLAGEALRITGCVQLDQPPEFAQGIHNRARIHIQRIDGTATDVASSCAAQKYTQSHLLTVPLRNELWFVAPQRGTYRVFQQARATRCCGQNPVVTAAREGTHLFVERWTPMP